MRRLGIICFWLAWPAFWFYFRWSHRTRLLVVVDDEFLAVKSWLGSGEWGLPGGGLHRHELVTAGAQRELLEETGIKLAAADFKDQGCFTARSYGLRYSYNLLVVTLAQKPNLQLQAREISEASWFNHQTLPQSGLDAELLTAVDRWWH